MRVFVTGASGFIGSHLVQRLLDDGFDVHVLVRDKLASWRLEGLLDNLPVLEAELSQHGAIGRYLEHIKPECCIHLAWMGEARARWTSVDNLDAVSESINFFRVALDAGCRFLVGMGSCAEYDLEQGYFTESRSLLRPATLYAACKVSLYYVLEQLCSTQDARMLWLRPCYLYGPKEQPNRLVPYIIRSLLRGEAARTTAGTQQLDHLHVEDVASAIAMAMQSDARGPMNIGSGQAVRSVDLITKLGSLLGRSELLEIGAIEPRPHDPQYVCANIHKLLTTGWSPRYDMHEGLWQTIQWWQAHLDDERITAGG